MKAQPEVIYGMTVQVHLLNGETLTYTTINYPSLNGVSLSWTTDDRTNVAVPCSAIAYIEVVYARPEDAAA